MDQLSHTVIKNDFLVNINDYFLEMGVYYVPLHLYSFEIICRLKGRVGRSVDLAVFFHLGFWNRNLFLIVPFPDLCLLVPFFQREKEWVISRHINHFKSTGLSIIIFEES